MAVVTGFKLSSIVTCEKHFCKITGTLVHSATAALQWVGIEAFLHDVVTKKKI